MKAAKTREQEFATLARDRTLVAVPHLSFPGIGHIRQARSGYEWIPVEYGNRAAK